MVYRKALPAISGSLPWIFGRLRPRRSFRYRNRLWPLSWGLHGNQKIGGAFSYLKENESIKYFVAPSTIFIEHDEGETVPTIIIADDGGNFKEKEVEVAAVAVIPEPEPEPEPIEEIIAIPSPQHDVFYKVQVAAGHIEVENNYFSKRHQLSEDIDLENHQGWIKYTFGDYKVYKDCRDRRNSVWSDNKITDAFVTAYNAGTRITVQEALMITNQKWYN